MGGTTAGMSARGWAWPGRGVSLAVLLMLLAIVPGDPVELLEALLERVRPVPTENPLLARALQAHPGDGKSSSFTIRNHVLFDGPEPVTLAPSPNLSPKNRPRVVVLHYSVSGSAAAAARWLRRPSARVSAHLLIDRSGGILQLIPFDFQAWHAGHSSLHGEQRLNRISIGIELVNWGPLVRAPDGSWRTGKGHRVPEAQVTTAVEGSSAQADAVTGWHRYTAAQIDRLVSVLRVLRGGYGIEDIVGHQHIAPGRKIDPGPAFPWSQLMTRLSEAES